MSMWSSSYSANRQVGDSLPDVPLPDVPLPDVPLPDVPLPDVPLADVPSVSNSSGLPGFAPGWTRNRGPGPGQEPPRNQTAQVLAGCYPDQTYTRGILAGLEPDRGSNCRVSTTLATIKYLSSDHIMT
jgi:hypothetical protein